MKAINPAILTRFAIIAGGVFAVCLFFRETVFSGFDLVPGDRGDARLNIYIFEHWWRVIQGKAYWLDPAYFYPTEHTLGYTHALFLNGVVYSVFRILGFDMYAAFIAAMMALCAFGYAGMFLLLRRILVVPVGIAIAVAILFINANSFFVSFAVSHPQYVTIVFLPWILYGMGLYWKNPDKLGRAGWIQGIATCLLLALVFYTSFYTGWFFVFWLGLASVWGVIFAWLRWGGVPCIQAMLSTIPKYGLQWLGFAGSFAVGLIPFLITYIPVLKLNGARHFESEVLGTLPTLFDFINTGHENGVWGSFLLALNPGMNNRPLAHEMWYGYPVLFLIAFAICLLVAIVNVRSLIHANVRTSFISNTQNYVIFALSAMATATFFLLVANFEIFYLWKVIFKYVPGASALRVISRSLLILGIPMFLCIALLAGAVFQNAIRFHSKKHRYALQSGVIILLSFFLIESLTRIQFARFSAGEERAFMRSIPIPPEGTSSFLITEVREAEIADTFAQIDAMIIAQSNDIGTFHGQSGMTPAGWAFFGIGGERYLANARSWMWRTGTVEDVYALDLETKEWSEFEAADLSRVDIEIGERVPGNSLDLFTRYGIQGWSIPEPWGVWNDGDVATLVFRLAERSQNLELHIERQFFLHPDVPLQQYSYRVNNQPVLDVVSNEAGDSKVDILPIPADLLNQSEYTTITIDFRNATSPLSLGTADDGRKLAIGLIALEWRIAPQ